MENENWAVAFYVKCLSSYFLSNSNPFSFFNSYAGAYLTVSKMLENGFWKIVQKT